MKGKGFFVALFVSAALAAPAQIAFDQKDDFNNGTVMGWTGAPDPNGPVALANQGPAGSGDWAVRVSAVGGFGPGANLALYNVNQWAGDYTGAGVTVVSADVRATGSPLVLRGVLFGPEGSRYTNVNSVVANVPADNQYRKIHLFIKPQYMVQVLGTETYEQVASNAVSYMIRHNSGNPDSRGTPVVATMHIDNIHATDHVVVGAASLTVTEGSEFSGNLASIMESDDDRYEVFNDEVTLAAKVVLGSQSPVAIPASLEFELEASAARPGLAQTIGFRNYSTNQVNVVSGIVATLQDSVSEVMITSNVTRFINQSTRAMEATLAWAPINDEDPAQDGWLHSTDRAIWRIFP